MRAITRTTVRLLVLVLATLCVATFYYGLVFGLPAALLVLLVYRDRPAGFGERATVVTVVFLGVVEATVGAGVILFESNWWLPALVVGGLALAALAARWRHHPTAPEDRDALVGVPSAS